MAARNKINSFFHNSQFNNSAHEKLIKQMRQEYDKLPLEEFFNNFIKCLVVVFKVGEKCSSVDLALDFAAKFGVSLYCECDTSFEEEMPEFLKKLFDWLFLTHYAKDQTVRFRVCQFIKKLLHYLGEEACLDDNLCDKISTNMLERLQDKVPAVREQAVMALQRLQDPLNSDCPIIKGADPSTSLRRSVLKIIGRSNLTLPHIFERTRDVKDTVRRDAYMVLSKLSIRSLTIKQRERLLREGLKDRSELVRNFVSGILLPSWLRNMKGNYMDLLHALDVENSTDTSILALKMLLKHRPLTEVIENIVSQQTNKLIPLDKLTPENVLFWRCVAQHLHAQGEEMVDDLDKIIPNLTPFCQYIRSYYLEEKPKSNSASWHEIQRQFVVNQLLELTKVFDLSDEMGRSILKKLIYDLLTCTHVKEGLVSILVELFVEVDPNVNSRLQFLAEIVSEVHEPMIQVTVEVSADEARKKQIMQAKIRVQLNEIREEQETAIAEQDFLKAHALVEKMKELEEEFRNLSTEPEVVYKEVRTECNDRATLSKCLSIIYEMMQSPTVTKLTPHLHSLMENFVMQYIEDYDTYVRSLALRATGVFCLLDQDLAKHYMIMLFYQLANNETDEVCIMALKVIFDIFHLYGLQPFQLEDEFAQEKEPDKTGKKKLFGTVALEEEEDDDDIEKSQCNGTVNGNNNNFIAILTSLLDSTSVDMRTVAAEGLCKLLLANRIKSPNLVSRLLIMWFNPITEGDVYLRQMLAAFFTTFVSNSSWGQETLEQAFLPTLKTLFDAPITSPLIEVDQDSVVRLLLNLTRPGMNPKVTQCNIHYNLAIALCNEVLVDPDSYNSQVLLRALTSIVLLLDDAVTLQNIKTLAQTVKEAVRDKICLRYIHRFQTMLTEVERTMTFNRTGINLEITNAASENSKSNDRQTLNREQSSPVNIDDEESDGSDNSQEASVSHPTVRTLIPESPDISDSPTSVNSADTCSSDMTQIDGETIFQTPVPIRSSSIRRSGRLAKRKCNELK